MVTNLNHSLWNSSRVDETARIQIAVLVIKPLIRSWQRLVFYLQDARFLLFKTCTPNDGNSFHFSANHVAEVVRCIEDMSHCDDCVDEPFGQEMLRLLHRSAQTGVEHLTAALQHFRIGSGSVERHHLLTQELKPARSRGQAVDSMNLGIISYVKSAVAEGKRCSKMVLSRIMEKAGITYKEFVMNTKMLRLQGSRRVKSKPLKVLTKECVTKTRRQRQYDAYRAFRKANWLIKARVGTPAFKQEEARIADLWKQQDEQQKAIFSGTAAAEENRKNDVSRDLTFNTLRAAGANLPGARGLRRQLYAKTLEDVSGDAAWSAGLGLCGPSTALRTEFIEDMAVAAAKEVMNEAFSYDPQVVPNPRSCPPLRSCVQKNGEFVRKVCIARQPAAGRSTCLFF